ncbi:MAG: carbohydrate ABC transporter permease [Anaerolineaceae bacterium]|nr:MAG: carbohydrate ABC transporter permease [Anaerolineaceae bacterium]
MSGNNAHFAQFIQHRKQKNWTRNIGDKLRKAGVTLLVFVFCFMMVIPFIWTISSSLKAEREIFAYPPQFFPTEVTFDNYLIVMGQHERIRPQVSLARAYWNSIIVTIPGVIGPLVTAILAAYAFARLKFPARDFLFFLYLVTMIVPIQVLIVPQFMLANALGIYNTHWALIIPYLSVAYAVFLLRQSFMSIPQDLIDAAKIDGAGHLGVIRHVIVPASSATIAALAILLFVWRWNDFTHPLIMLNRRDLYTIPLALSALIQDRENARTGGLLAGTILAILPLFVVFVIANRQFIRSMVHTGVKG